ncbi:ATP-binding protein [Pseudooceanicola sp. MF1-13]|uniref:ATP-binding protein n=1 Tax=Pseudooceanicola sp. MF1-13 TaxID=3379095 RepID=UPI003892742C
MSVETGRNLSPTPTARATGPGAVIDLTADPMAVRHALARLIGQLDPLGLEDEELGSIELVTAEALNNIVEHAYRHDPDGPISLSWSFGATGLLIKIEDSGQPIPPDKPPLAPTPCAREHATLVPEGGFGWFLIQGLARNIVYRREQGRNILTYRMAVGLDR